MFFSELLNPLALFWIPTSSQSYGFSSSHVWMWELDHKESWAPKKWCFQTVVLEKTLESHLDCKEIWPVHPKGNQSWIFIGRTDAKAETAILWPPDVKNGLTGKDLDAGKDWRREEKGTTENEMAGQDWTTELNWTKLDPPPLEGMRKAVIKPVNYSKLREVIWASLVAQLV